VAAVICRNCRRTADGSQDTCQHCGFPLPRQRATEPDVLSESSPSASIASAPVDDGDPFAVPSLSLHVQTDDGRMIELEPGDRLIVGRTPDSPLSTVCGDNISFRHAEIYVSGESAFIVDTNSTNGTFVDGERLVPGMPRLLTGSVSVHLAMSPPMQLSIDIQRVV
jgi:hypothetical protein